MKTFLWSFLAGALLALTFFAAKPSTASASYTSPLPEPQGGNIITCSSNSGGRVVCPADTRAGVSLVNQRSDSPCVFGRTWGYDARSIWVDRGCRADFQTTAGNWGGWDKGYNIYCASDNGGRQRCPTDTRGGVQMARQRSSSPCIYGQTWGWDGRGVWVDRGCRADFQIGSTGGGWRPGGPGWQPSKNVVTCSSNDGGRNVCATNTNGGVRLIRQRSDADCIYQRTWGYDRRGIWVDRGCRADFEVGGY